MTAGRGLLAQHFYYSISKAFLRIFCTSAASQEPAYGTVLTQVAPQVTVFGWVGRSRIRTLDRCIAVRYATY